MKTPAMRSFYSDILKLSILSLAIGLAVVMAVTMLAIVLSTTARAETNVESTADAPMIKLGDVQRGSLLFKTDHSALYRDAPVLDTDVQMQITALLARVRVKQSFRNEGSDWVEGVYVFPLPENAAVDHMRMRIGERVIEGQIKERQQAKKIYQQARQAGKKAALIEQQRPNIFTNSVANIGPGETVVVEIEYQQTLQYDNERFSIRFPMVITPRFIPGQPITPIEENLTAVNTLGWSVDTDQVPDASRITPPVIAEDEPLVNPVSLHVDLNAGIPLQSITSPYHQISIQQGRPGSARIELAEGPVPADRDFVLEWVPVPGAAPRAALFTEPGAGSERDYSLLMVMPPASDQAASASLPREVIYIIDTSGSMGGLSIRQARAALQMAIKRLRKHDRFNVIQFNSNTSALFQQPVPVDAQSLQQALHYVGQLQAGGGTMMEPALKLALSYPESSAHVRQVMFLTDGAVGNERALFKLISDRLGHARLFTVGIGSAPNSFFMRKAAQFGRGTFTYIGDLSEVEVKMKELFAKLETPVMRNLKIQWPAASGEVEMYPARLPDLYAGEPLMVTVAAGRAQGEAVITGLRGDQPWTARFPIRAGAPKQGIGVLWARSRIASLMDSLQDGANKDEVRKAVIDAALEHHLVSKYTSLVAVDVTPTRPENAALKKGAVPTNLPNGMIRSKVFGNMPKTATSAPFHLYTGLFMLLMLLCYRVYSSPAGRYWRTLLGPRAAI